MSVTRKPQELQAHVCLAGERPRVFVDWGCGLFSFWFDDEIELRGFLADAIRREGMPAKGMLETLEVVRRAMGSYEGDDVCLCEAPDSRLASAATWEPAPLYAPSAMSVALCLAVWGGATAVMLMGIYYLVGR